MIVLVITGKASSTTSIPDMLRKKIEAKAQPLILLERISFPSIIGSAASLIVMPALVGEVIIQFRKIGLIPFPDILIQTWFLEKILQPSIRKSETPMATQ